MDAGPSRVISPKVIAMRGGLLVTGLEGIADSFVSSLARKLAKRYYLPVGSLHEKG